MDFIMDEMREWNRNLETMTIPTDPNGLFVLFTMYKDETCGKQCYARFNKVFPLTSLLFLVFPKVSKLEVLFDYSIIY